MLHLKLHTTSTTGHVVVTVISVGHWQFCRRVFATVLILLPSTLPLSLSYQAGWLCLRRWVAFGRSSHMQERKARACCSCNAHVLARRSNSMLSCKSLWLSPALSCSTLTPMTSCEHNFSRIFSTTTCCLRLRDSLSKLVNRIIAFQTDSIRAQAPHACGGRLCFLRSVVMSWR